MTTNAGKFSLSEVRMGLTPGAALIRRLKEISSSPALVKELVLRWYPGRQYAYPKTKQHEALADIRESIAELAHYRRIVFK
jgi:oligoribonuclease (3'-5' exoribonuclease)